MQCDNVELLGIHRSKDWINESLKKYHSNNSSPDVESSPLVFHDCKLEEIFLSIQPLRVTSNYTYKGKKYMLCVSNNNCEKPNTCISEFEAYMVCVNKS